MKCKKCGSVLFTIQIIPCCDDCDQNGAWDEDTEEYTYDLKTIDSKELDRTQVYEEGECRMDTAYGPGCHMYTCSSCHHKENLPLLEGC